MEKTEQLKQGFESLFPTYAAHLNALCESNKETTETGLMELEEKVEAIQKELLDRIAADLRAFLEEKGEQEKGFLREEEEEGIAIQLRPEKYEELINAKGDEIETELLKLMDELQRLKDIDTSNAEAITAAILGGGLSAITAAGITYITYLLTEGDPLLPAAFATVQFCSPTTIVAAIAVIIVLLLIPLIYFVEKPAVCILLVINELRQDLLFKDDYCVHGKRTTVTKKIPKIASSKESGIFYSAGLFASQKRTSALIGTQYGFTLQQEDIDKIKFNFGVECPLSQGKNSCIVGYNQTSKSIAEQADEYQKQQDTIAQDEYVLDIKCHSSKGSVAYYIARVSYK